MQRLPQRQQLHKPAVEMLVLQAKAEQRRNPPKMHRSRHLQVFWPKLEALCQISETLLLVFSVEDIIDEAHPKYQTKPGHRSGTVHGLFEP